MYLEMSQDHFSSEELSPKWEKQIIRWERETENQSKRVSGNISEICDFFSMDLQEVFGRARNST